MSWTPRVAMGDTTERERESRARARFRRCGGGGCEQASECVRWLRRGDDAAAERFIRSPWEWVPVLDATGRPVGQKQACEWFLSREAAS